MSKEIQNLFHEIAPQYDRINRVMSLSIDVRWREKALQALKGRHWPCIVDLCAGTLDLSKRLLELFPESEVLPLDFTLAMLQQGQYKIQQDKKCAPICADGHHIPLPDNSIDAIICAFGIRNLENRPQAAKEIFRILRPRGKLVVLEFFRPNKGIPKLFYSTYGKWIIPRVGGMISKKRSAYQYLQDSIQAFLSIEEYKSLLKKHGFKKVECTPLSFGIVHRVVADVDK